MLKYEAVHSTYSSNHSVGKNDYTFTEIHLLCIIHIFHIHSHLPGLWIPYSNADIFEELQNMEPGSSRMAQTSS